MTDNLRDMLQNVMGPIDTPIARRRLGIGVDQPEWLTEARAALAAAPQPAPVMQYYYKDNTCPAEYGRAENCICWHNEGKGPFPDLKNGDAIPLAYGSAVGLTWRAAPQPVPEREALVDVVAEELRATLGTTEATWLAEDVADALLARGLRLPGDETMAWAVLGEDGKMVAINYDRMTAQHLCNPGERIERVAIRVVEGGE